MKILIPVDYSAASMNACDFALGYSAKSNSHLIFLHVINSFGLPTRSDERSYEELVQAEKEREQERLKAEIEKRTLQLTSLRVSFEVKVEVDDVHEKIKEVGIREKVNLIIMGTSGANGMKRALFGSNTSSVLKHTQIPLLVIPQNKRLNEIKVILMASDFDIDEKALSLDTVEEIINTYKSELKIVHVVNEIEKVHYLKKLAPYNPKFIFSAEKDVVRAIEKAGAEIKLDLLVLFPGKHSSWDHLLGKSITTKMTLDAEIPLLAIPK